MGTQNCWGSLQAVAGEASTSGAVGCLPGWVILAALRKAGLVEVALRPGSCWPSQEGSAVMDLARQLKLKR